MVYFLLFLFFAQEPLYEAPECVSYGGYARTSNAYSLRFYNGCGYKTMIYVCMEKQPGKFTLEKSPGKVPSGGSWMHYLYDGTLPRSMSLSQSAENLFCGEK